MDRNNQNRICSLLGIRYPIIQAPMNWVSGAALTAAVSEAGGMGTLGPNSGADKIEPDPAKTAETMRQQIRKVIEKRFQALERAAAVFKSNTGSG
ncbi:MAG: nitronate monooxygenase [Desulfobacterales bacterium]